jgi:hypothetical protein
VGIYFINKDTAYIMQYVYYFKSSFEEFSHPIFVLSYFRPSFEKFFLPIFVLFNVEAD